MTENSQQFSYFPTLKEKIKLGEDFEENAFLYLFFRKTSSRQWIQVLAEVVIVSPIFYIHKFPFDQVIH